MRILSKLDKEISNRIRFRQERAGPGNQFHKIEHANVENYDRKTFRKFVSQGSMVDFRGDGKTA